MRCIDQQEIRKLNPSACRRLVRSTEQWDKDDCAAVGLVKFDLLGLGMLSAIPYTVDLIREHEHIDVDIANLDLADSKVYDMLCAADAFSGSRQPVV